MKFYRIKPYAKCAILFNVLNANNNFNFQKEIQRMPRKKIIMGNK
jgi:hypothetical protein